MSLADRLGRRFRWLRLLRASLIAGALYDLGFAVLMVLAPGFLARVLRLPLPGPRFYLWLIAVLLAMVASLYLVAAHDPRRYSAVIAVAIAGRAAGAAALALAAWRDPGLTGLWGPAAGELAFAVAHTLFWWPLRA
jgi:hypothetical protein